MSRLKEFFIKALILTAVVLINMLLMNLNG